VLVTALADWRRSSGLCGENQVSDRDRKTRPRDDKTWARASHNICPLALVCLSKLEQATFTIPLLLFASILVLSRILHPNQRMVCCMPCCLDLNVAETVARQGRGSAPRHEQRTIVIVSHALKRSVDGPDLHVRDSQGAP
jgi:hypothetical protein